MLISIVCNNISRLFGYYGIYLGLNILSSDTSLNRKIQIAGIFPNIPTICNLSHDISYYIENIRHNYRRTSSIPNIHPFWH